MRDTLRKSVLLAVCVEDADPCTCWAVLLGSRPVGLGLLAQLHAGDYHGSRVAQKWMKKSRNNCSAFMTICPFFSVLVICLFAETDSTATYSVVQCSHHLLPNENHYRRVIKPQ